MWQIEEIIARLFTKNSSLWVERVLVMGNIKNLVKNASKNGSISEDAALSIATAAENLLERSADLLKDLKKQVGTMTGERIDELLTDITGVRSKESVYYLERESDGQ